MLRRTAAAAAATMAATLVAGCGASGSAGTGGSPPSAQAELLNGMSALTNTRTLTATAAVKSSPAGLRAFVKPTATLTAAQAKALSHASVVLASTAPAGKKLNDRTAGTATDSFSVAVTSAGTTFAHLVGANQVLYLQADLRDGLRLAGKGNLLGTVRARAKSLPPFVRAFVAGNWVSLPLQTVTNLLNLVGGGSASSTASPQAQSLVTKLRAVLAKDVTTRRVSRGTTDHLVVSGNTRTLASDLLGTLAASVPGVATQLGSTSPSSFPSRTVSLDAYVSGGVLTRLTVDLAQFRPHAGTGLPLEVSFTRGGPPITAPSGATAVDTTQLGTLVGALQGGATSS